jgi:uncharacterized protein (TIGR02301 family)
MTAKTNDICLLNAAGLAIMLLAMPVQAQEPESEPTVSGEATPPAPQVATPRAPYDDRLIRLSEIVGSVHYLRELCAEDEDSRWRTMMGELIAAEAPEADRRERLTAAFNRGYRSFASVYRSCTPSAAAAESRYRSEGATLASEIIARFGN